MRKSVRPFVDCAQCGAKIHCSHLWADYPDGVPREAIVHADWAEPPRTVEKCPKCQADVDTTTAYPAIPKFPPTFDELKKVYEGFKPKWEHNRRSFDEEVGKFLSGGKTLDDCQSELNDPDGFAWFKQRMFYRSTTGFYRALQLFSGYLTLDKHCYRTWADITAYYSRFYFIQSFLNLILSTYLNLGKVGRAFIFFNGNKIVCTPQDKLPTLLKRSGSHDMWWSLMEAMKSPGYPCENLDFVLSDLVFNPERRQELNYDYDYAGGGFPELNWFDSGWKQMYSHFTPRPRVDADITDMNRFFGDCDPEQCDVGDFYGDDAQIIWHSLVVYLQLMKAFGFEQNFIKTENVVWLSHLHIGKEYPAIVQGIAQTTSGLLNDGFDLAGFKDHPNEFFNFDDKTDNAAG
jgi:hypothetical protein